MSLVWMVEQDRDLPVMDANHLKNHMNYLFRTDRAQKWTNDETSDNVFINVTNMKMYQMSDLEYRTILRDSVQKSIDQFYRSNFPVDDYSNMIYGFLHMFCIFLFDNNKNDFVDLPISNFELQDLVDAFHSQSAKSRNTTLFSLVYHQDQENPNHVHGLFFTGKPYEGQSHFIQQILSDSK